MRLEIVAYTGEEAVSLLNQHFHSGNGNLFRFGNGNADVLPVCELDCRFRKNIVQARDNTVNRTFHKSG